MVGISKNVVYVEKQKKSDHKGLKQTLNAGAAAAGLLGTYRAAQQVSSDFDIGWAAVSPNHRMSEDAVKMYPKQVTVYNYVTELADKLFPKGGKIDKFLQKFVEGRLPVKLTLSGGNVAKEQIPELMNKLKGKAAIVAVAGAAAAAIAGLGTFMAGRISKSRNNG